MDKCDRKENSRNRFVTAIHLCRKLTEQYSCSLARKSESTRASVCTYDIPVDYVQLHSWNNFVKAKLVTTFVPGHIVTLAIEKRKSSLARSREHHSYEYTCISLEELGVSRYNVSKVLVPPWHDKYMWFDFLTLTRDSSRKSTGKIKAKVQIE